MKNGRDEQLVIRADDFEDLKEAKKNIDKIMDKREVKEEPKQEAEQESLVTPKCPECGKEMVKRDGRYGSFWGCSSYPECKGMVKIK